MLQAGKNITAMTDPLQKLQVDQLFHALVSPKAEIRNQVEQLRTVLTIDPQKYAILKKKLPYVTCGIFNPPLRKSENFASIEVFILDIDHLSLKGFTVEQLKEKLKSDKRIELMFSSPGGDGLKLLFRLSEKCYDLAKYSMFYKLFAQVFSEQYDLSQVIDKRTSDVTRACFISIDEQAFYQPDPEKIPMNAFINFDDPLQMDELRLLNKSVPEKIPEEDVQENLTQDILQQIRLKLNPKIRTGKEKNIFVPEELNTLLPKIEEHIVQYDMAITSVTNISYGKQIRFTAGVHFAEINIFYGKKGYKVVPTTKTGTNTMLTEIATKVLCELLF